MATQLLTLLLLCVLWLGTGADPAPAPGRVPKVYNALITSNQNLEPSKAYPVYQPVLHDAFAFSYQPAIFYGGDLLGNNGLLPAPGLLPKEPQPQPAEVSPVSTPGTPAEPSPSTEAPTTTAEPAKPESDSSSSSPSSPPATQSPIPLNEFGLPPQVLPLGHIDPLYNALPQFSPFTYRYPGVRFYDPYDPFNFSPYTSLPIYRPLPNLLGHSLPVVAEKQVNNAPALAEQSSQTPPPEPSDLNILNYASKDPAIPNVPPPPLPQGGLKTDKSE
ncbi:hypothetical protein PYW07_007255 [Mythimna separata]|uniref:Uncharacterized protein n=1 Tax=Mythimna separata TaxID=271217 RepID=A0AAD7Z1Y6_MYTSE|nr:hypothetical protein PYW07_007255 [Mythimna separata]